MSCLHALPSFLVHSIFFVKITQATATNVMTYLYESRHQGKHSPQHDGSRHCQVVYKAYCKAAHCVSSSTFFVCLHHPFDFCLLDVPPKKSKKNPELKKLMGGPCYICKQNGYQMAGLQCNVDDTHV